MAGSTRVRGRGWCRGRLGRGGAGRGPDACCWAACVTTTVGSTDPKDRELLLSRAASTSLSLSQGSTRVRTRPAGAGALEPHGVLRAHLVACMPSTHPAPLNPPSRATRRPAAGDIAVLLPSGAIRIVDRKKNIFKLSQGEYVAVEQIESTYKKATVVEQVRLGMKGGLRASQRLSVVCLSRSSSCLHRVCVRTQAHSSQTGSKGRARG